MFNICLSWMDKILFTDKEDNLSTLLGLCCDILSQQSIFISCKESQYFTKLFCWFSFQTFMRGKSFGWTQNTIFTMFSFLFVSFLCCFVSQIGPCFSLFLLFRVWKLDHPKLSHFSHLLDLWKKNKDKDKDKEKQKEKHKNKHNDSDKIDRFFVLSLFNLADFSPYGRKTQMLNSWIPMPLILHKAKQK